LMTAGSRRDYHLLQEYMRACRRTGGIVLALGNDVVMLNDHARQVLDPSDQAALIGHATEALSRPHPGAVTPLFATRHAQTIGYFFISAAKVSSRFESRQSNIS